MTWEESRGVRLPAMKKKMKRSERCRPRRKIRLPFEERVKDLSLMDKMKLLWFGRQ